MKLKLFLLLLCSCCILASCGKSAGNAKSPALFFAWTEGYLANPVGEESSLALTFYCKKNAAPFSFSEIADISFEGLSEQPISFQYTLMPLDIDEEDGYLAYGVNFTYTPEELGVFEAESLVFTLSNNDTLSFPFGHFVFDIDEADSEQISTWESPAATSNSTSFPYRYLLNDGNAMLTKIQTGINRNVFNANGLEEEGAISLEDDYSAPVVLVKAKLQIDLNGESFVSYGKGCYCGAVNAQDSILKKSLEHWSESTE